MSESKMPRCKHCPRLFTKESDPVLWALVHDQHTIRRGETFDILKIDKWVEAHHYQPVPARKK